MGRRVSTGVGRNRKGFNQLTNEITWIWEQQRKEGKDTATEEHNSSFIVHGQFVGLQEHLQPNAKSLRTIEGVNMCNSTQGEENWCQSLWPLHNQNRAEKKKKRKRWTKEPKHSPVCTSSCIQTMASDLRLRSLENSLAPMWCSGTGPYSILLAPANTAMS